ncbi:hypothetical protein [Tenacibaculum jejuense]|uniref:Uncharacterized protein n=1 Tax=Tenacibaculum jejuense TaxID=584609 RepID=A0A238U995_9FLAO|nr:hypothetical protein [Tenacibaculum jejuense]SNR15625.1 protein of unknown function [Tenacibaculum jejuense]
MKKSILNLGKTLNKQEQQTINGGSIAQDACINGGGKWVCVGAGNCGCVVGIKPTGPHEK